MVAVVVFLLDPGNELTVENFQVGKIELPDEKTFPDGSEKSLNFSFCRSVSHRCVAEDAADSGADEGDFLGGIDGAIVHIQTFGHASLVEGRPQSLDKGVDVFLEKELSVAQDARGIVNECNEFGLNGVGADLQVGTKQGVGLPHFIGVLLGKGQPMLVGDLRIRFEHFKLGNDAAEGIGGDFLPTKQSALDADAVNFAQAMGFSPEKGESLFEGIQHLFWNHLAGGALVGTGFILHSGDSLALVAVEPCGDGSPGEVTRDAILVGEWHLGHMLNALAD